MQFGQHSEDRLLLTKYQYC